MIEIRIALIAALLTLGSRAAAQQVGETVTKRGTIQEDQYIAGGTVDVKADVQGDVVVAGGSIVIGERVTGDVLAAGGTVDVGGEVLDDVRAVGGTVTLAGHVGGDAIAAGGTVVLGPGASVGGRAWFGGGDVQVAGRIARSLKAGAGKIVISGVVEGDVQLSADQVEILPSARITGSLSYRSPNEARIDPAAVISGGVVRLPYHRPSLAAVVLRRLLWIAALGALGAVLILTFPGFSLGAVRTLGGEPWKALGLGAAVLLGGPLVAVFLIVTVIGSVLGIAGLVAYALALLAGFLTGVFCTGDMMLAWLRRAAPASPGASVLALVVGLVVIALVRWIPVLGGLVVFGVLLFGLGALVLHGYRAWRDWGAEGRPLDVPAA